MEKRTSEIVSDIILNFPGKIDKFTNTIINISENMENSFNKFYNFKKEFFLLMGATPARSLGKYYHYTPAETFTKIVNKDFILRFTRYDCLNDYTEGKEIEKYYKNACNELVNTERITPKFYEIIKNLCEPKNIDKLKNDEPIPFICCFSQNKDSLPMWNYYVKNQKYQGYAIGCDFKKMLKIEEAKEFLQFQIQYNNANKKEIIQNRIMKVYEADLPTENEIVRHISLFLSTYKVAYKNIAFKSEKEIRAVKFIKKNDPKNPIKYEMVNGIIKPYVEIIFKKEALKSVILSPASNNELGIKTMQEYLEAMKYSKVKIEYSKIPIRY